MRIATSTLYQSGLDTIGAQQATLIDLQNQIASAKRVATAGADPAAASQTVRITAANAKLDQYTSNLSSAQQTLQLEDSTLGSVTTLIQQAQAIVVAAGNGTLDNTTRAALASQIESIRDQLQAAGNTTDGQGNYLFGGYETGSAPFSSDAAGNGVYLGSQGQRSVQVGDTRQLAIGDVGSRIFQGVAAGADKVATAAANTGSATFSAISTTDSSAAAYGDSFSISFKVADDGTTTYSVHDATAGADVVQDQPYQAGTAIAFGGQSITVSGAPGDGDSISVGTAQSAGTDVFGTLTNLAAAIRSATTGSSGNAQLTNALTTAGVQLSNSLDNVLTVQASVGAREQEADTLSTQNTDTSVQYQAQQSALTGADLISAYSQFTQVQTTLQAAEKTFIQIQNLSLFDLIK